MDIYVINAIYELFRYFYAVPSAHAGGAGMLLGTLR
jgi:hypothetical protein